MKGIRDIIIAGIDLIIGLRKIRGYFGYLVARSMETLLRWHLRPIKCWNWCWEMAQGLKGGKEQSRYQEAEKGLFPDVDIELI